MSEIRGYRITFPWNMYKRPRQNKNTVIPVDTRNTRNIERLEIEIRMLRNTIESNTYTEHNHWTDHKARIERIEKHFPEI